MIWCLKNDGEDVHNDILCDGMRGKAEQLMTVKCVSVSQHQGDEVFVSTDGYVVNTINMVSLRQIFGESPCLLALVITRVLMNI